MGFCTANSIDLVNMTSSGDECARQGTNAAGSKRDNFAAGERAMSGPLAGPQKGRLVIPGVRGEQVAFVANGLNTIGLRGVVEQFFAQAGDSHVDAAIHPVIGNAA